MELEQAPAGDPLYGFSVNSDSGRRVPHHTQTHGTREPQDTGQQAGWSTEPEAGTAEGGTAHGPWGNSSSSIPQDQLQVAPQEDSPQGKGGRAGGDRKTKWADSTRSVGWVWDCGSRGLWALPCGYLHGVRHACGPQGPAGAGGSCSWIWHSAQGEGSSEAPMASEGSGFVVA